MYQDGPVYQTSTKAFKAAAKRAGLPADFRWHDLRHLWASWLAQDGTPILALQKLGSWQSESMVRRYAHFSIKHLRPYVDRPVEVEGNAQETDPSAPAGKSDQQVD
ncbi:MAG: tyrosine-type recombinase/integrase [Candidatus Competibacteraceae bacterium]